MTDDLGHPIRSSYEKVELQGDLNYKLFITNVKILADRKTFVECQAWLEEHIAENGTLEDPGHSFALGVGHHIISNSKNGFDIVTAEL